MASQEADQQILSTTEIETLDILSEGPIEGPVSGEYIYSGQLGSIGWNTAQFSGFAAAPNTTARYLRSIYWNEMPVVDSNNQFNFQQVDLAFTNGLPNGASIGDSSQILDDTLSTTRPIGEILRGGESNAKYYRILNKDIQSFTLNVRIPRLSKSDTTSGNVDPSTLIYSIFYKPIFSSFNRVPIDFSLGKQETINDKILEGYIRSSRVILPTTFLNDPDFVGWEIKVIRYTENSTSVFLSNDSTIDSLTEEYGKIFTYPNTALVSAKFNAEFFQSVPNRSFDTRLLKVKIPNNYNPILRTYGETRGGTNSIPAINGGLADVNGTTDVWNGTFKTERQWTDNPAWCFYDLITNKRYGLGNYIDETYVDKWTLFEIAKYCDTLVPDGNGGLEPRFTCNLIINTKEEAFKVINDFASIFRGITYYANGLVYTVQDNPKEPKFIFNNANVVGGDFSYSSSSRRVRHTVAIIRYNDRTNFYKPAIEYVEDIEGIKKYGIREVEITAFGCTSKGQALRLGRWALLTETLETESINFAAGMDMVPYLTPGDVIQVFDVNRKAQRYAGRTSKTVLNPTGACITLDSQITGFTSGQLYNFAIAAPTYFYNTSQVSLTNSNDIPNIKRSQIYNLPFSGWQASGVSGNRTEITFYQTIDSGNRSFSGNLIWSIEATGNLLANTGISGNNFDYYRVINIEEKENNIYAINGIQYSPAKYSGIESGLNFEAPAAALVANAPSALNLSIDYVNSTPNTKIINYDFFVNNYSGVSSWWVYAKRGDFGVADFSGNQYVANILPTGIRSGSYIPSQDGDYYFRVYGANSQGIKSTNYASNFINVSNINPLKDIVINSLRLSSDSNSNLQGNRGTGEYTTDSPEFQWNVGFAQNFSVPSDFTYRITLRQPSNTNVPTNNIYYESTGFIPASPDEFKFTFDIDDNTNNSVTYSRQNPTKVGPFREYDIVVEAMTSGGNSSAGGNFINNGDALYDNPNGYDIFYANNPRISGFNLTGEPVMQGQLLTTDEWITADGTVKIAITSGNYPTDTYGGYVYTSSENFTQNEAFGLSALSPSSKVIKTNTFIGTPGIIEVPANLVNFKDGYVAVSLYDEFDKALIDRGYNIKSQLELSTIKKIEKRLENSSNGGFAAWLDVPLGVQSSLSSIPGDAGGIGLLTYGITFLGIYKYAGVQLSDNGYRPLTNISNLQNRFQTHNNIAQMTIYDDTYNGPYPTRDWYKVDITFKTPFKAGYTSYGISCNYPYIKFYKRYDGFTFEFYPSPSFVTPIQGGGRYPVSRTTSQEYIPSNLFIGITN